jgi:predicted AAA+ superfamily ATPase
MLVETFVLSELMKLQTVSETPVSIWQWREREGREVGFVAGIVLHLGTKSSSFGERIHAVPVSALWGHAILLGSPIPG